MSKREKTAAEIEHEFDSAEVPSANIKATRPFSELLEKKRIGRPPKDSPKVLVTSRYDADIIERFRAKGDGWQTRMNDALRTYLMEHEL